MLFFGWWDDLFDNMATAMRDERSLRINNAKCEIVRRKNEGECFCVCVCESEGDQRKK